MFRFQVLSLKRAPSSVSVLGEIKWMDCNVVTPEKDRIGASAEKKKKKKPPEFTGQVSSKQQPRQP